MSDVTFKDLGLKPEILTAIAEIGYETPSPIQAQAIPALLSGKDILGMAQTGTGKTAAFALPALSNADTSQKNPQVLVLAPTRELAIQVSEAFQTFAHHMKGFHVLPIYGGSDYGSQIRALKRGVQVVVGTPGRVMDHMRKGTLKLDDLKLLVLDEADEMLRMGFIDDVEWVLEHTPDTRQIALFSATMPNEIHRIASNYLNDPIEVIIKQKTATAITIAQKFLLVSGGHKLDALTRILEAESSEIDGMIIFVRTKNATIDLAEKLEARGYSAAALNGDIAQNQRERIVDQLKTGKLDILVATDVVARGLDVPRISHVVNFDIPQDNESYVHRIGRTGRAGRSGTAILFVTPRERRLLKSIERTTKQLVDEMHLPSAQTINDTRVDRFKTRIVEALGQDDLSFYQNLIEQVENEQNVPAAEIAAALARMMQGDVPFFIEDKPVREVSTRERSGGDRGFERDDRRGDRNNRGDRGERRDNRDGGAERKPRRQSSAPDEGMSRYRIEVGRSHGVRPGNIVGCIANEANIDSEFIRQLTIEDSYSMVDLPEKMSKDALADLKKAWVCGQQLKISEVKSQGTERVRLSRHSNKDAKPNPAAPRARRKPRD
ncbi:ATP-dependent RNA helicase DeaD [Thiosulfatimonas sediminis]|uniref:ATP-dependent RNA helicase DeaD n=1 Tax=Thiosulfatimonas sediminis TaxID=2675054 RepID=A0A6F8PRN8_9GAMM|nr:DEAD/DEAH box helicase [Thiosulfatimonas sediminis]BBP44791.1 ATP-dependent RNA helicase DeaD [Thiosulfatimonas sediminis]